MGIELVEDGLKNVKGTVQYPKEFENVWNKKTKR
jgi:hypothetical protein